MSSLLTQLNIINHSNETKYEFLELPNQSALKKLKEHPRIFKRYMETPRTLAEEYQKEYFAIGSMVDCLIFEPEKFNKQYVLEVDPPKPQELLFINYILDNYPEDGNVEILFEDAFKFVGAKNKKIDHFISEYAKNSEYIQSRLNAKDRFFAKKSIWDKAHAIKDSVLAFEPIRSLIKPQSFNCEAIYQMEIKFAYKGLEFKAKLDCVVIDHANKTIKLIDLKTTGDYCYNFKNKISEYGYDFQAAFYSIGFLNWAIKNRPEISEYIIDGFYFAVESSVYIGNPLIFHMSEQSVLEATKSVIKCIDDYKFYLKHGFERMREEIEAKFIIKI